MKLFLVINYLIVIVSQFLPSLLFAARAEPILRGITIRGSTLGANPIELRNKLECLCLASLSSLV
jgi:hypothetical protein